ncbi:MAG: PTS sugar transporter subunit IIC [Holdemanella sp.]|nr:PTS sugar transporter subunit IIC [Holdemanella sp.]
MEGLFNSPIILKLQEFGQKLGANTFVSALQSSMMGCMGFIMCGSVFQIITALLNAVGGVSATSELYLVLYAPYNFTMGLIGLWITIRLAEAYAKNLGVKSPITSAVEAGAFFVLVATFDLGCLELGSVFSLDGGMTFLGSTGMFVGFIVAFITVRIDYFCQVKNIKIPMPDVCPPSLVNGMAAIIPSTLNAVLWLGISFLCAKYVPEGIFNAMYTHNFAGLFMSLLAAPLAALTSTPGMFVLILFATLMWCFGIHGTMLLISVLMAPLMEATAINGQIMADALAAGKTLAEGRELLQFFPVALFGAMAVCGGTGNTLPLCIFGLRAKSEQIRTVSKIGILPGWFGINEPVTFGMPIMYNPILCIPYILNCQLVAVITLLGYKLHIIYPGHIYNGALLPMGFAQVITTLRPIQFLWDYAMLIPAGLVWYPFFKAYDKQLYEQEQLAMDEDDED